VPGVPGGSLVVKVERYRADGLGLRAIATKLGISVNTLRKARGRG
jgi:DNA-binding CsgD family transcriptional regulator